MTIEEQPPERRVLIQGPGQSWDARQEIIPVCGGGGERGGRSSGLGLGNAYREQGAGMVTVTGTVPCSLLGVYDMPSPALGTFHCHSYIIIHHNLMCNSAPYL